MDFLAHLGFYSVRGALINAFGVLALYGVWEAIHRIWLARWLSPLGNLPGPKRISFFWGNTREILNAGPGEMHEQWVKQYGHTFVS
ncbi:hypothetical protein M422DRAFT_175350 [Sphaerobolus stellatus SS14]|uniref:Cytochrome P450 n=1 Tax=Sphaerobolus stellatus (strain SS14) TaxID=990650 RepID=A0A0C9VCT0_SPHS4|nr:hypothetical protein M422DRAFT_175350 [Sphaerobolus stellatus SS14]